MASDIKLTDNGVVVEGGELHSIGGGYSFADRTKGDAERWVWYAQDGEAHLWSNKTSSNKLSVSLDSSGDAYVHAGRFVTGKWSLWAMDQTIRLRNNIAKQDLFTVDMQGTVRCFGDKAGFQFADRIAEGKARFLWYAQDGTARLQHRLTDGKDLLVIDPIATKVIGNLTVTGALTQASSIALKENVAELSAQEAMQTLQGLNAVKYNYKADEQKQQHIGFIAEEVPDLVANSERDRLSPMDIVAVLTKAVQEQQKTIAELTSAVNTLKHQNGGQ